MIETVDCDQGCGASLFKFAGITTCPECQVRLQRQQMLLEMKAAQWDHAMTWLDHRSGQLPYPLHPSESLLTRLEDLWRQLWD